MKSYYDWVDNDECNAASYSNLMDSLNSLRQEIVRLGILIDTNNRENIDEYFHLMFWFNMDCKIIEDMLGRLVSSAETTINTLKKDK